MVAWNNQQQSITGKTINNQPNVDLKWEREAGQVTNSRHWQPTSQDKHWQGTNRAEAKGKDPEIEVEVDKKTQDAIGRNLKWLPKTVSCEKESLMEWKGQESQLKSLNIHFYAKPKIWCLFFIDASLYEGLQIIMLCIRNYYSRHLVANINQRASVRQSLQDDINTCVKRRSS